MDAFFAAVEVKDFPELVGKPVVVGGSSSRGVVATASYEARRFGIHSAQPMVHALERCSHLIVRPPRMKRYQEVSRGLFEIFRRFTPVVEGLSLDEAFLDVTGSESLFGSAFEIAKNIRRLIWSELGLTASAGVATNKFLAKLASEENKPDGLTRVQLEEVEGFLSGMPIERMWGVGRLTAKILRERGICTIGGLNHLTDLQATNIFGSSASTFLLLAKGIDLREVISESAPKSVGSEHTFEIDTRSQEVLEQSILQHSFIISARLFDKGYHGKTVTLKLKDPMHGVRTCQRSLKKGIFSGDEIYQMAREILRGEMPLRSPVRLVGLSVSNLSVERQTSLFQEKKNERCEKLEKVRAQLRTKFGKDILTRGTILGERSNR